MTSIVARLRARLGAIVVDDDGAREQERRASGSSASSTPTSCRTRITVTGRVLSVTVRSKSEGGSDLIIELAPFDRDAPPASLVMLGRREVVGINPGASLRVHGMAADIKGRVTLFNPAYELLLDEERS